LLWVRYGDFGFLAGVAMVIYLVLMLFFLQAISFVQLTLPGLAGIILSIGMAVDGTVIIFERFREEYKSGKKIPLSVKNGFKRAFWPIFDSNITTVATAIVLYILGTSSIQGFAITLLIGILLSMFMNLVILRFLVKWYLPLNSIKPKKLHLPKQQIRSVEEDDNNEIVVEEVKEGETL
ncbi:MAG: MMPL family transporter, partial [Clostridia bacterium]|nr:MMPL family transporter [Clostridia bacterium]